MRSPLNLAKKLFGPGNIVSPELYRIRFLENYKIAVFVPAGTADTISKAMSKAGAGVIGQYTECSFRTEGKGTFRGGEKSKPVIGKKGRLEKVDEIRLEMLCPNDKLDAAVEAMLRIHPYEEPAYDIYPVVSGVEMKSPYAVKFGLRKTETMEKILRRLNRQIDVSVFPENLKRVKVSDVIIDFLIDSGLLSRAGLKPARTLYISKNLNGSINIRLLQPGSK